MQKKLKIFLLVSLLGIGLLGLAIQPVLATESVTAPSEVRIGNMISVKLNGLTVGSNYIVTAAHSDGNVSKVLTASASTEYIRFVFATADSDGLVPIHIGAATVTGVLTGPTIDTALVNLINPGEDIPSSFFQNLLAPVLIIGIFVLLMGAFFIHKRMK